MKKQELEKYVGKFVEITIIDSLNNIYYDEGYLSIHKMGDFIYLSNLLDCDCDDQYTFESEEDFLILMERDKIPVNYIVYIGELEIIYDNDEENEETVGDSIYEYFGHEIGDWTSKPIEE